MVKSALRKKSIKKIKRRIPWIDHIINERTAGDLNLESSGLDIQVKEGSLCLISGEAGDYAENPDAQRFSSYTHS